MYRLMGMGLAVVAFLATAIFVDQLIARGFLETCIPGGIAAYFTYKYFAKKDDEELQKVMHPPAEVWPMSLPVAWGTIRDVLDSCKVQTGTSGQSGWRVTKEDDSRGIISAEINFSQMLGAGANSQVVPRTIGVTAILTPEGSSTKVELTYNCFSPMGAGTVKQMIADTHAAFQKAKNANAGGA